MTRRAINLALTGAVLAAALWLRLGHRNQASFQGRSVDYWFRLYLRANYGSEEMAVRQKRWKDSDRAKAAIISMGSNAVPYLLVQTFRTHSNSGPKRLIDACLNKLPESWGIPKPLGQDLISWEALRFIRACRPAISQVAEFVEAHLKGTNTELHVKGLELLACCEDARGDRFAYVVRDITNADLQISAKAFELLRHSAPIESPTESDGLGLKEAQVILPSLLTSLKAPNRRFFALWTIGTLGHWASETVPVLIKDYYAATNLDERLTVAEVLTRVDPDQVKALLTNLLQGFESASLGSKFKIARVVLTMETNQPLILNFLNTEWANETNDLLRLSTWRVLTYVLHTNLPSPNVPISVLRYQSPAFERWLALGVGVKNSIRGPTLHQWLAQAGNLEPQFEGLLLKRWLYGQRPGTSFDAPVPLTAEGERALRAIGTNAIPWLLTWTKSTNSLDYILARRGFGFFRHDALVATPALLELVRGESPELRARGYGCLTALQLGWTNAWQALVPVLHNPDKDVRSDAAVYLFRSFPEEAEQVGLRDFISPRMIR